jgi:hypothetical protein
MHVSHFKYLFFIIFLFCFQFSFAQEQVKQEQKKDTTLKKHSPKLAATLSAVLPGAGQVYNRKYWKVPFIYAFGGTLGYIGIQNYSVYNKYRKIIISRTANGEPFTDEYAKVYSTSNLITLQNQHRSFVEYCAVGLLAVYALQIVDALVDGHLYHFDVSEDLSFQWQPNMLFNYGKPYAAVGLTLNFKK